jgi:hypothetical protein
MGSRASQGLLRATFRSLACPGSRATAMSGHRAQRRRWRRRSASPPALGRSGLQTARLPVRVLRPAAARAPGTARGHFSALPRSTLPREPRQQCHAQRRPRDLSVTRASRHYAPQKGPGAGMLGARTREPGATSPPWASEPLVVCFTCNIRSAASRSTERLSECRPRPPIRPSEESHDPSARGTHRPMVASPLAAHTRTGSHPQSHGSRPADECSECPARARADLRRPSPLHVPGMGESAPQNPARAARRRHRLPS